MNDGLTAKHKASKQKPNGAEKAKKMHTKLATKIDRANSRRAKRQY